MISARLPDDENGKITIIVGLTGYELDQLMVKKQPVVLDMTELGASANLIFIARPSEDQCVEVVKNAVDCNVEIIDKRPEFKDILQAALEARARAHVVEIPVRRGRKKRR